MDDHSTAKVDAYVYQPLHSPQHIRLMTLQPSLDPAGHLFFSFSQAHCEDVEGEYEALSYTWGEPRFEHNLYHLCNKSDERSVLLITSNLDTAIRRLRKKHSLRVIWIDAICINQLDNEEKAVQIPLMASIYHSAKCVVAWLGPVIDDSDEEKGMKSLVRLSRRSMDNERYVDDRVKIHGRPSILDGSDLHYVICFLCLPWFTRLWVIQEVVLNVDVLLLCGTSDLTWIRLLTALNALQQHQAVWTTLISKRPLIGAIQAVAALWYRHVKLDMRIADDQHGKMPFIDLVEQFRDFGCAEPRDRIFAIFSLSDGIVSSLDPSQNKDTDLVVMPVDYSKNVFETYTSFTLACLRSSDNRSKIFQFLFARQWSPQSLSWSSWVLDWRRSPDKYLQKNISDTRIGYYGHWHRKKIKICIRRPPRDSFQDGCSVINEKNITESKLSRVMEDSKTTRALLVDGYRAILLERYSVSD
ncbi:HET-domain-containing protein [Setomelanomma holmii]|uniref:HET-domain-containing protein n=1 Tax=Setomelanomma holmii TaxID=210430 RepID=A0A9P4H1D7_9PLEO|nr:HET-domain-containing protein [Setomelanomma holmii]